MPSIPTSDHNAIREWASRNDAVPALVTPRVFDAEPAILHFLFGRAREGVPEINPITWENFFAQFDLMGLMMIFDDSPTFQIIHDEHASVNRSGSLLC